MTYVKNSTAMNKNCYDVYLRVHGVGTADPWTSGFAAISASDLKNNDGASSEAGWADDTADYTDGYFGKIGTIEEKPSIEGNEGEEINTAACDAIQISEMLEGAFNDMEVTEGNYEALRGLAANGYVDVLFYDALNPTKTVGARKVRIRVLPSIVGNDLNRMKINFKKEVGNIDNYFAFVTVSS